MCMHINKVFFPNTDALPYIVALLHYLKWTMEMAGGKESQVGEGTVDNPSNKYGSVRKGSQTYT